MSVEIKFNIMVPKDFLEYDGDEIMSNYDGLVMEETVSAIKGNKFYSHYSGWHFNGKVWFQDNRWHCEVWQYHSHMETISANSPQELMTNVSDKYGYA